MKWNVKEVKNKHKTFIELREGDVHYMVFNRDILGFTSSEDAYIDEELGSVVIETKNGLRTTVPIEYKDKTKCYDVYTSLHDICKYEGLEMKEVKSRLSMKC
jgi:hypothetical protein